MTSDHLPAGRFFVHQKILFEECDVATMAPGAAAYGLIRNAKIVVEDGVIVWVGPADDCPSSYSALPIRSLGHRVVTPALIDCHTHLVFGGNRAREFERRLQGASYEQIAREGGGIISTVEATRNATFDSLVETALTRLDGLMRDGVQVVEIKSGYGLTIKDEIRMLKVARHLEKIRDVKIVTTWLGAHAVPPDYKNHPDLYIKDVVIPGLIEAHEQGLVDAVDGFCETIGFTRAQITPVFDAAKALGLPVKLHAEQLSDQKGALLVGAYHGLSADHLEYLNPADVEKFAASGAVAVLLPGAYYTLKETQPPPIALLRKHKVPMAIATDCNPGSAPLTSLLTAMNMGCTLFGLEPEEALAGVTRNAASALGLSASYGVIAPGMTARLAVWDIAHPAELSYWLGSSPLHKTISMAEMA